MQIVLASLFLAAPIVIGLALIWLFSVEEKKR